MKPDFWGVQVLVALLMLVGLPVGLAVWTWRPAWLESMRTAADARKTTAVLCGAGLLLFAAFVVRVAWDHPPTRPFAVLVLGAAVVNGYVGLAGGSWAQGRAMLRRDGGLGCLTWGWLARASLTLVPLVGLAAAAYLGALAFGTPLVAWFSRNRTVEPSAGSTPAS
jgi:hypothetical protein